LTLFAFILLLLAFLWILFDLICLYFASLGFSWILFDLIFFSATFLGSSFDFL